MEGHLEVLLELCFFTKPLKFGVEAHMEAPTGVALRDGGRARVHGGRRDGSVTVPLLSGVCVCICRNDIISAPTPVPATCVVIYCSST
jgi:hypothetical protein